MDRKSYEDKINWIHQNELKQLQRRVDQLQEERAKFLNDWDLHKEFESGEELESVFACLDENGVLSIDKQNKLCSYEGVKEFLKFEG